MGAREGMNPHLPYRSLHGCCVFWLILCILLSSPRQPLRAQEPVSPPAPAAPPGSSHPTDKTNAENPTEPSPKPKTENGSEISQTDSGATFKVRVNLVQVHVIVREPSGKAVGNLTRQDFLLYDQGKLQTITNFSVETPESRQQRVAAAAQTQGDLPDSAAKTATLPERFVGLVFDDIHLTLQDSTFVRQQADKFLDSIGANDRVAIFSTSGQITVEFTSDKEALHKAILGVSPHPLFPGSLGADCPEITYYMADQIVNKADSTARSVAVEETIQCQFNGDESKQAQAATIVDSAAMRQLSVGDQENNYTYRHLEDVLRRMSAMPGQRIMVLVSPGFILANSYLDESGIIDRANRANVVINTLDARGLYTPDVMGDISRPNSDSIRTGGYKTLFRVDSQFENQFVLSDFAYGTGGTFFHNSNDLQGGLELAALAPDVSYVLGFSPQNRKLNGQYHVLTVKLASKNKYSIQARRGYFAPRNAEDPHELARQEIQEAIFSQEEINEMPLDLQTQYFKSDPQDARLSVVSRLDLKNVHFRKADGRSFDDLTVATAIFDENGNFVTGGEKTVQMRLRDPTYERLTHTGLTVKSSFAVKPGRYLVRQVVRDSEGSQMAARNGAVDIPF
jgi:VWFA-related protein